MINLLKHETDLLGKGYNLICGVDEVGRGSLAGPLVACAVVLNIKKARYIRIGRWRIDDSKLLPKKIRKGLFRRILKATEAVGIGIVDVPEINHIENIDKVGFLARYRAVQNLGRSNNRHCHIYWHPKDQNLAYAMKFHILYTPIVPHYILVDGPFGMPEINDIPIKAIVKGGRRSISIASASIIAKVYRDKNMINMSKLYPQYGWERNVGYSTTHHLNALNKYGITPYHRIYFEPCREVSIKMMDEIKMHQSQVTQAIGNKDQLQLFD